MLDSPFPDGCFKIFRSWRERCNIDNNNVDEERDDYDVFLFLFFLAVVIMAITYVHYCFCVMRDMM